MLYPPALHCIPTCFRHTPQDAPSNRSPPFSSVIKPVSPKPPSNDGSPHPARDSMHEERLRPPSSAVNSFSIMHPLCMNGHHRKLLTHVTHYHLLTLCQSRSCPHPKPLTFPPVTEALCACTSKPEEKKPWHAASLFPSAFPSIHITTNPSHYAPQCHLDLEPPP